MKRRNASIEPDEAMPEEAHMKYGHRLIPSLIDEKASSAPDETYCYLPRTARIEDGFQSINYRHFSNAINACSWWIEAEIGKSDNFATLAYLGPSDLRNILIIVAAIKTGHKVFSYISQYCGTANDSHCGSRLSWHHLVIVRRRILIYSKIRSVTHSSRQSPSLT